MSEYSLDWILAHEERFRYQLLNRMQTDCVYYLENGHSSGHLWTGDAKAQIKYMKGIWNSFPEDGKPEWLTWAQIESFEAQMCDQNHLQEDRDAAGF